MPAETCGKPERELSNADQSAVVIPSVLAVGDTGTSSLFGKVPRTWSPRWLVTPIQ